MNECLVIIPALNPTEQLIPYTRELADVGFSHILIVNDGSEAEFQTIFDSINELEAVTIIDHEQNLGKGAALKTAFNYYDTTKDRHNWHGVITVDADGQHLVDDVLNVYHELEDSNNWLILGTRRFDADNVPRHNRLGNRITTNVFKMFYGKVISDTQTGLRGISDDLIEDMIHISGERFEYEMNMLIWAVRNGVLIREVTIKTVYINENETSHFRPVIDSFLIYKHILSSFLIFIAISASSFLIDISIFQFIIFLFGMLTSGARIGVATVIARLCSSFYNYMMNKTFVFKDKDKIKQSIFKYYLLMVSELALSATFVFIVFRLTFFSELYSKLIVDASIFILSFFIQKYFVFKTN